MTPNADRSFFAVECSSLPPEHVSAQHAWSTPRQLRLVLEHLAASPAGHLDAPFTALWVVEHGRVTRFVDLHEVFELNEDEGTASFDWAALEATLPVLRTPLLAPGESATATIDEGVLPEGVDAVFLFGDDAGRYGDGAVRYGSHGAGDLDGEDLTPDALRT
jgi:hypothetical protein